MVCDNFVLLLCISVEVQDYMKNSTRSTVFVFCAQLGGAVTEKPLNMGVLLRKRVSLICSTLRSRSLEYKHRLIQEVITVALCICPRTKYTLCTCMHMCPRSTCAYVYTYSTDISAHVYYWNDCA